MEINDESTTIEMDDESVTVGMNSESPTMEMDTESNTFFPLTSLPNEIIKIVLEKLDWKSIYNLRLVSKFFNTIILNNFDRFSKPEMRCLRIESDHSDNGIEVEYSIECELGSLKLERTYSNEDEKDDLIQQYLKRVDLTDIPILFIAIKNTSPVFKIITDIFDYGTHIGTFDLLINDSPIYVDFSNFLEKLNYIEYFNGGRLCFSYQQLPPDIKLPIRSTLHRFCVKECECTKFINQTMINNLFENNKNLSHLTIYSRSMNYEEDIVRNFKEKIYSCTHDPENHKLFEFDLAIRSDYNKEREYNRLFPCGTYSMLLDHHDYCSINVNKKCNKCYCDNRISIRFEDAAWDTTHLPENQAVVPPFVFFL